MSWEAEHEARVATFPQAIREAHVHSSHHRLEVVASDMCGCFYCLAIYSPIEITVWTDSDANDVGQTALCPRCGIDSVIGDVSGFPITVEFLTEMKRYWS